MVVRRDDPEFEHYVRTVTENDGLIFLEVE
jgi:hypothetical protein